MIKPEDPMLKLTRRETEIVTLVAAGMSNREIALEAKTSEETVKRHVSTIFDKTGMSNRTELAVAFLHHPEWADRGVEERVKKEAMDSMKEAVRQVIEEEMQKLLRGGVLNENAVREALAKVGSASSNGQPADAWIQTYSGSKFYPFAPTPESIFIEDVAHHLSLICRFNGACAYHYSVAQHSLYVAQICEASHGPRGGLYGLLHDAPEAYLGDIVRPIKRTPAFVEYLEFEDRLQRMMFAMVGLDPEMPDYVKEADDAVLATEKQQLMTHGGIAQAWELDLHAKAIPGLIIKPQTPILVKADFLIAFDRLAALVDAEKSVSK